MSKPPLTSLESTRRAGYPLLLLFLAITFIAALLAMNVAVLGAVQTHRLSPTQLAIDATDYFLDDTPGISGDAADVVRHLLAMLIGAACGLIPGALMGLYHYRRVMGFLLGAATGAVIAALAGPVLCQLEKSCTGELIVIALGSSAVMLGLGMILRRGGG